MATSSLIPLSGKRGAGKFAVVDPEHYELLSKFRWHLQVVGYAAIRNRDMSIAMHRVVIGATSGQIVDHINGDKLDNRSANLRFCDKSLNALNKSDKQSGRKYTSKYRGVSWSKIMGAWLARIVIKKKVDDLGYFSNEDDAYGAYSMAQSQYIKDGVCPISK